MKKIAFALPLAIVLGSAGSALAVDVDAGTLTKMNPATGEVTMTNGHTYKVSNPVLLNGLIPGEKIIITVNDDKTVGLQEDSSQWDGSSQTE